MADSIKWQKVPLTIDTGENNNFLKANYSAAESSSEVEFLLRQVTPGFDETTQTNFALLQMLNNNGANGETAAKQDQEQSIPEAVCISTTIDDETCIDNSRAGI